ncbi:hypothetical protein ZOSMA_210G00020 [Zostera marina]|uniref:Uncharacterized protein n=1 Tax=Zostera marina TaxID=29655 RepID=A0A0K9PKM2_ZOSMR|nr:hypothetical protein ZOSMA_210G00020 [Zostera marina]
MEDINQEEIFDKEVSQFYANMVYSVNNHLPLISSRVNNTELSISKELLAGWSLLPSNDECIHLAKYLSDLPFICTIQQLWLTFTRIFNPSETNKIYLKDLTGVASVLIKLIDNCLCPMSTTTAEPSMIAQVTAFCILKRIKVDWVGLVMYNMTTVTLIPDGTRHYPRLISKLLDKYHLNRSLCRRSKVYPLQHFTAASFKHKLLNQFHDSDKEFETISDEMTDMKHILDAHIDMALLNTDTIMTPKGLHANRDDFDLEVVRQLKMMNQNLKELENQVKLNEARVRVMIV